MIEYMHCHPSAFDKSWKPVPKFTREYNFDRYNYRVFGIVYEKDSDEFRDAVEKVKTMRALMR